jgi:hypothetical protein
MSEVHKKNFVYSAKRLKYFFNHIKEGDLELVDQRAQVQQVSPEEYGSQEQLTQVMEEATLAIAEAKKFADLIDSQEK